MKRPCKISLLSIFSLFIITSAFCQENKNDFELKGKIYGINTGIIYLSYYSIVLQTPITDSSLIINGSFHFSGSIAEPEVAFISIEKNIAFSPNSTNIFIEPGALTISLKTNNFKEAHVAGSAEQSKYEILRGKKTLLTEKHKQALEQLEDLNTEDDLLIRESLSPYFDSLKKLDYDFFDENPTSFVTAYLLQFHLNDLSYDSIALFYNRMGDKFHQNPISERIAEILRNKEKAYGTVGSLATTIIVEDDKGKKINLNDYRGKYLLFDFWASWCIPCRKNSPQLKEIFQKYKDKSLVIIGIADDTDIGKWKEAIHKDGTNLWTQIRRKVDKEKKLKGLNDDNDINYRFGIKTLPTYILIDPDGIIIGRYEDETKGLDNVLAGIFK